MSDPRIVYFIDENDRDRNANLDALQRLFADTKLVIEAPEPFDSLQEYSTYLAREGTAAFLIDQNMRTSGLEYDGIDLAGYLRGIDRRIPIYILTGGLSAHADIGSNQFKVEAILSKDDIDDPGSDAARVIKARILRNVDVHSEVVSDREARFHALLLKSLKGDLDRTEMEELGFLEGERLVAIQAVEISEAASLEETIVRAERALASSEDPQEGA